jgi:hypothetical protein
VAHLFPFVAFIFFLVWVIFAILLMDYKYNIPGTPWALGFPSFLPTSASCSFLLVSAEQCLPKFRRAMAYIFSKFATSEGAMCPGDMVTHTFPNEIAGLYVWVGD